MLFSTLLATGSVLPVVIVIALLAILLIVLISCIKIVPQGSAYVVERLGAYRVTWNTGMHFKLPFIETISKRLTLMEQVADFPPQPVIISAVRSSCILATLVR